VVRIVFPSDVAPEIGIDRSGDDLVAMLREERLSSAGNNSIAAA
jgi:hypothetical protein